MSYHLLNFTFMVSLGGVFLLSTFVVFAQLIADACTPLRIILREDELVLSKDDKETIVPYKSIESFEVITNGKRDVLLLRMNDGSELKLGLPQEPRHSEVLSEIKAKLSVAVKM